MSKKVRYLICAVIAACACLSLGVLAILPPRANAMKEKFDRVHIGMTLMEIDAILGNPAMSARRDPGDPFYLGWNEFVDGEIRSSISIQASKDGIVTHKEFGETTESIPAKLSRWLHLPK